MSVSTYERFLGYDWERYAFYGSKITCVACGVIGFLSVFLGGNFITGAISSLASLVLSIWEFPWIFFWLSSFQTIKETLEERYYFKYHEMKGAICIVFALMCFRSSTIVLLSGFLLFCTGLTFFFAALNRRTDESLQTAASGHGNPNGTGATASLLPTYHQAPPLNFNSTASGNPANPQSKFGTF
jgi:hypothetical protein